ncbi:MAG: hypothetical protein JW934_00110 [Anaerolineae bacterium]|nr:hypothetical protein [Anaerolineae bacterium]
MKRVCFLINDVETINPTNCLVLANALLARGDRVYLGTIDALVLHAGGVLAQVWCVDMPLDPGETFQGTDSELLDLAGVDAVWVLGFGRRESFLDKIQLLWTLSHHTCVINSVDALMHLHSKYHLGSLADDVFKYPETWASSDFDLLWRVFREQGGTWVAKPPARSLGRDVFLLRQDDVNARVILQNMTGNGGGEFCIMQRYIPEIVSGEKRVLIAGGQVVGQYKRVAQDDHRTNLHQGAVPSVCGLDAQESELCDQLGQYLTKVGAYFAGVDLVYPYVLEVNVLSPGGILTILELTGRDLASEVIERVIG